MFPKVNMFGQTPSYERQAGTVNFFANPGAITPVGTQTQPAGGRYGQYDNALEHGFNGVQYRDGAVLGEKFNVEW